MTQHIGVRLLKLNSVNVSDINIAHVIDYAKQNTGKYPVLSKVDPYGTTVFNKEECDKIVTELSQKDCPNCTQLTSLIQSMNAGESLELIGD
jgi:hypothetical protein